MNDYLYKASHVTPSERQLKWHEQEFFAFVHFGVNTFTDREWGNGKEDPIIFNPKNLNTDQWVSAIKSAGMKGVVLTAKHHDGFCLWPTKYTEHSVKNSTWRDGKGDVVRELRKSCDKYGIKLGIYLSPWDRHDHRYGTDEYNTYYKNQLTELMTNYGEIFLVWLDGACGEGRKGKKQEYDLDGYYEIIRKLQPQAIISGMAPDVKGCGNEAGICRESEWCVVPSCESDQDKIVAESQQEENVEFMKKLNQDWDNYGCREHIKHAKSLIWYPSEVDTSIRPRWFYHRKDNKWVRSLNNLLHLYCDSVGGNNGLLFNIPPTKEGVFYKKDVRRLEAMGKALKEMFKDDLMSGAASKTPGGEHMLSNDKLSFWQGDEVTFTGHVDFDLGEEKRFNLAVLTENIRQGQRIEEFRILIKKNSQWHTAFEGTTIGNKKICRSQKLKPVEARYIRLEIIKSRFTPQITSLKLYMYDGIKPLSFYDRLKLRTTKLIMDMFDVYYRWKNRE